MAESVPPSTGQILAKLLIDEAKFLWGVEDKVNDLQKELELIQDLLRDAGTRQGSEPAVVTQLRNIAYDAEDVVERYFLKIASKKERNIITVYACFAAKCMCVQTHKVGTEIDALKSNISSLRTSMQAYGTKSVNEGERGEGRASLPTRTFAHFQEDIVGRENSVEVLVKELLEDGENHRVVSIWGMGGLGKTTLARQVLVHEKVKKRFEGFGWACLSQKYNVKDILLDIILGLIPDQSDRVVHMRDNQLFDTLYKTLQEKRCIVVLDDIWTQQAWEDIKEAFPIKKTESKLLITTRKREVAMHIDPRGFLYELQCLSDLESWELLKKRVFLKTNAFGLSSVRPGVIKGDAAGQDVECITRQSEGQMSETPESLKTIGGELLSKCEGLPLAIIVLAGLLTVEDWGTVRENVNLHIGTKSHISPVLELSYYDLPWHLKSCFLYLGGFPINKPIPVKKVLHMWIAEGFVPLNSYEGRDITMEDIAGQYLMDLVNRGMVQARFSLNGKMKTCRLHDQMRELCIEKARKEMFLRNSNDIEMEVSSPSTEKEVKSTCKTRRLSLYVDMNAVGNAFPRVEPVQMNTLHLRALLVFNSTISLTGTWKQFQSVFSNYRFLRVLNLEGFRSMAGDLPESVGDLIHLRYLSLAGCMIKDLPQSMGNLVCMEYLDLHGRENLKVIVPNVLWKMRRLRYLHLPTYFIVNDKEKLQLRSLKNLWTLKNLHPDCCDLNDLGNLTNLRKLTFSLMYSAELKIIPQLANFTLKYLKSSFFSFRNGSILESELSKMSSYQHPCKLSIKGKIEKLPEHKHLPQKLRKLILLESRLEEDPMPILEKLQNLVVLLLGQFAFEGKEMVSSTGGFPKLKHLVLQWLQNLEKLSVAEGAMPLLCRLQISECPKLNKSAHVTVLDMFSLIGSVVTWEETEESKEDLGFSLRVEKKKTKSKSGDIDFALGRPFGQRTGAKEQETSDEGEL